ncbi:MAG: hypothetical protein HEQ35_29670 [Gloeotrichia echinulata IR180]
MEQLSLFSLPITARDTLLIPRQWRKFHLGYLGKFEIISHSNRKKGIEYTIEYVVFLHDQELATAQIITSLISTAETDFRDTVEKLVNNHHAIATDDLTDSGHFTECVRPQKVEEFADEHYEPDNSQSVRPQQITEEFADEHYEPDNSQSVRPQKVTEEFADEHTHWVQDYWVKRGNKKHHYYRYCWMVGRKKHCIHLGSTSSTNAKLKKQEIELAIARGLSPEQIIELVKSLQCFLQ